jgi:hypothetical protein
VYKIGTLLIGFSIALFLEKLLPLVAGVVDFGDLDLQLRDIAECFPFPSAVGRIDKRPERTARSKERKAQGTFLFDRGVDGQLD